MNKARLYRIPTTQRLKETTMNKDQIKGTAHEIAGKMQEEAGRVIGSNEQQAKGLEKQVQGHIEKAIGDVKEGAKKVADAVKAEVSKHQP